MNYHPIGIDYADQNNLSKQRWLDKFRVQLPLILFVTVCSQLIFDLIVLNSESWSDTSVNSIILSAWANASGLLGYRRLRLYPGSRRLGFLLPSFALSYVIVAFIILFFRIPYSASQLLLGIFLSVLLSFIFNIWNRKPNGASLILVPSSRTKALIKQLPNLAHRFCNEPEEILGSRDTIIADLHRNMDPAWQHAIAQATLAGANIFHVRQIEESLTGKVHIDHLNENTVGSLTPDANYALLKSITDRIGAAILLFLTMPFLALICLAIRLDSRGSPIYRQQRIGYRGKSFTIFKLRTMVKRQSGDEARDNSITTDDDIRITRIGRILRDLRIDEVPQLLNVIRGEMSLIGPRPEAIALSEWYAGSIDFYPYRHIVLPGITGWAQVKQGHVAQLDDIFDKLQYDFYYIKHFSLWLDILITFKTVAVILSRFGAR